MEYWTDVMEAMLPGDDPIEIDPIDVDDPFGDDALMESPLEEGADADPADDPFFVEGTD